MKKGIIFDLDGTLWDSSKAVVESWNEMIKTFPDVDYLMTEEQMKGYMGKTMHDIAYDFFHTVSKERAVELLSICTEYENEYIRLHGGVIFDGLIETLEKLHQEYFLAIVSNCQIGYIEAFIEYYKLDRFIDDTENYGRTLCTKDKNIAMVVERNNLDKAVYVGDIMGDYESAMKAGIGFIHAAYGFGTVPAGTPFINSITELPEAVAGMTAFDTKEHMKNIKRN